MTATLELRAGPYGQRLALYPAKLHSRVLRPGLQTLDPPLSAKHPLGLPP